MGDAKPSTANFVSVEVVKALLDAQPNAAFLWIGPPPSPSMDASMVLVTDDRGIVLQLQLSSGTAPKPVQAVF